MIPITFDDKKLAIASTTSLSQLLLEQGYVATHFAVAVNRQFVPRNCYATYRLNQNDVIDIIMPMQGG